MEEKPNLGRVINVPGKSELWSSLNRIVCRFLLAHFLIGDSKEWKTNAIQQLKEALKKGEQPDYSNYEELSGSKQIALNAEGNFAFIEWDMYGSYDYVSFEHAHAALMQWSDVNGNFVDKYDYWSAVYYVLYENVIPAIHKWIEEVEASDPKWMDNSDKEGFSYPIFSWNEEKQTTVFASAMWQFPHSK